MHLKLVLFLLSKMWKQPFTGFVQNGYSETYCKTHIKTIEIKPFFSKVTGSRFAEDSVVPESWSQISYVSLRICVFDLEFLLPTDL